MTMNDDDRLSSIERRLSVNTWQVGALAAIQAIVGVPAVWLLLRVAAKVGALS